MCGRHLTKIRLGSQTPLQKIYNNKTTIEHMRVQKLFICIFKGHHFSPNLDNLVTHKRLL